jgi:uncharacterized protein
MTSASSVACIVRLNGGRLIGKTRLQKSVYFLEALGAGFGFDFSYHHYGPYSEELANLTDDAKALGLLKIKWHTSQDGSEYAVFEDTEEDLEEEDEEANEKREGILRVLKEYSAVELELAATADFLSKHGYQNDPWAETRRRKGSKLTDERMGRAKELLRELLVAAS